MSILQLILFFSESINWLLRRRKRRSKLERRQRSERLKQVKMASKLKRLSLPKRQNRRKKKRL